MRKLLALLFSLALLGQAEAVVTQTLVGNANYTILSTDQRLVTTAAFTAARTWTLPSAGATCIGQTCPANSLEILDVANAVTATNSLTIAPASGETINGSSSSLTLLGAGDRIILIPTSGSNWFAIVTTIANQTEAASLAGTFNSPRNILDNGATTVQQRGTGTATAATTAGCVALSYASDRWCADVNVTSGIGQLTPITATPAPPTGFTSSMKLVKSSSSLAQPVCAWQEIPTKDATTLAGQNVILSGYIQALAGQAADGGNVATFVIITGTGSDEGLGALRGAVGMTASPAITPAWTGLATLQTTNFTTTTGWVRYIAPTIAVPSTVTEMAIAVCFTPSTVAGGATDGLAFTGMQLEAGKIATPFEFRFFGQELVKSMRYYWQAVETNTTTFWAGQCRATGDAQVTVPLPVPMDTTPVVAWTAGGFSVELAGATLTAATGGAGANLANAVRGFINLTFSNACTAGNTVTLSGTNTTGKVTVSADF